MPPFPTDRDRTASIVAQDQAAALSLVITTRSGVVSVSLPEKDRATIGRSTDCDIVIDDPSVSRLHATLFRSPVSIVDNASRHGTVVMGRRLAEGDRVPLPLGATIEIGQATIVLVRSVALSAAPVAETNFVTADPAMRALEERIAVIAASPLAVLIQGETGTGKELFSRAVHTHSPRAEKAFVAFNCAAVPETLVESELFGYERGAFTGATHPKPGLFEVADGGTLFLDEVGDVSPATQAKLLRVLESGEVARLGSIRTNRVDVRIVAATNRDLAALARANQFRADLYYRLNGFVLTLPPLRERAADIEPLANHFARRMAERLGRMAPVLSPGALDALKAYDWPGNVRELRNVVERAVALSVGGTIVNAEHLMLPTESLSITGDLPSGASLDERGRILNALRTTNGNQTEAARLLGISRQTLLKKLDALGVGRPRKGRKT